jgi:hypothetical protein
MVAIAELMDYWRSEPPTHVLVAEFLGVKSKRRSAPTEEDTRKALTEVSGFFGPAQALPPEMKRMIQMAEEMKRTHKGLIGNA